MAQTSFAVPTVGGEKPPAIGSRVQFNEMIRPMSNDISPTRRLGMGYSGDNEGGWLSRQAEIGSGEAGLESGFGSTIPRPERSPRNRPLAAAEPTIRMEPMPADSSVLSNNSNSRNNNDLSGIGSLPKVAGTQGQYHEALRDFFQSQVEPLYFLSPNPSMTEDQFRHIVKDVAKRYWLRYPPETKLGDEIKKEIVLDVKAEISRARTADATPRASPWRAMR